MHAAETARQRVKDRGPRWAVMGTIRPGEAETRYAVTAIDAEKIQTQFLDDGRYQIRVHPPEDTANLSALGRQLADARAAVRDITQQVQAAVIHAVTVDGRAEAEVARQAGVDRMTVRGWLGK